MTVRTKADCEICRTGPCVEIAQELWLTREVTPQEIRNAMFDIGVAKSPGPDGFNSSFFHAIGLKLVLWWYLQSRNSLPLENSLSRSMTRWSP